MAMAPGGGAPPPVINPLAQALMAAGSSMLSQGYSAMPRSGLEGFGNGIMAGMNQYQNALAGQQAMEMQYAELQQQEAEKQQREQALNQLMQSPLLNDDQKALLKTSGATPQTLQYGSQMIQQAQTQQAEAAKEAEAQAQVEAFMQSDTFKSMNPDMQQLIRMGQQNLPPTVLQGYATYINNQLKPAGGKEDRFDPFAGSTEMDNAYMQALSKVAAEAGVSPEEADATPELRRQAMALQADIYTNEQNANRKAGAQETAQDKTIGEAMGGLYASPIKKAADNALVGNEMLGLINQMDITTEGLDTGKFSQWTTNAANMVRQASSFLPPDLVAEFGVDDTFIDKLAGGNLGQAEAATAVSNRLALMMTGMLSGQISEKELEFSKNAIAQLTNSPQGRQAILNMMRQTALGQVAEVEQYRKLDMEGVEAGPQMEGAMQEWRKTFRAQQAEELRRLLRDPSVRVDGKSFDEYIGQAQPQQAQPGQPIDPSTISWDPE